MADAAHISMAQGNSIRPRFICWDTPLNNRGYMGWYVAHRPRRRMLAARVIHVFFIKTMPPAVGSFLGLENCIAVTLAWVSPFDIPLTCDGLMSGYLYST